MEFANSEHVTQNETRTYSFRLRTSEHQTTNMELDFPNTHCTHTLDLSICWTWLKKDKKHKKNIRRTRKGRKNCAKVPTNLSFSKWLVNKWFMHILDWSIQILSHCLPLYDWNVQILWHVKINLLYQFSNVKSKFQRYPSIYFLSWQYI